MYNFVSEFLQKNNVVCDEEIKQKIDRVIDRKSRNLIASNIAVLRDNKIPDGPIARLIALHPSLFLLNPNPDNNESIVYKTKMLGEYGIGFRQALFLLPNIVEADLYENSPVTKALKELEEIFVDKLIIGKLLINYPCIVNVDQSNENDNITARIKFWKQQASLIDKEPNKFLIKVAPLLRLSVDPNNSESVFSLFKYYKDTFHLNDIELLKQVYSFPNFVGLSLDPNNPNSVDKKLEKLNEVGLSNEVIGQNLKVLGIPVLKAKARYIIYMNFGLQEKSFLNGRFMINEKKLYARAKFLQNNSGFSKSLIAATENKFHRETNFFTYEESIVAGITYQPLCQIYTLDETTMMEEQNIYNKTHGNKIYLNQEEIDSIKPKMLEEDEQETIDDNVVME